MKFEITDTRAGFHMLSPLVEMLTEIGDILLYKEDEKYKSFCYQSEKCFNYHGIEKALCGKTSRLDPFTPKRILVIQMK